MIKAGIFSSSTSLVIVPNIIGLTSTQAVSAISNAELLVGTTTTTSSGATSINNGTVSSQSEISGALVERYSVISYVLYDYVVTPPPPPPGPPPPPSTCYNTYSFTYYDGGCNYDIYNCNGIKTGSTRITSCSSPGTDSTGATIPGCSTNCAPPPPPPPTVTCSSAGVHSTSYGTCPSGLIQDFTCSDGSSYSQCI